jgi:hypothetical protein
MRWSRSARPPDEIAGQRRGSWLGRCCPAQLRWPDGRRRVRRRMRRISSQLWLEIRQFPWWRHQKVAGNVLANMRSVLAREGMLKRPSLAERRTVPTDRLPEQQLRKQVSPNEELIDVLSWGEQVGLIGSGDRLLLSSLVEHTDRLGVRTSCRSGQGLMSASALAETAAEFGLSPGTVRRRARRSIDALASACRSGRCASSI